MPFSESCFAAVWYFSFPCFCFLAFQYSDGMWSAPWAWPQGWNTVRSHGKGDNLLLCLLHVNSSSGTIGMSGCLGRAEAIPLESSTNRAAPWGGQASDPSAGLGLTERAPASSELSQTGGGHRICWQSRDHWSRMKQVSSRVSPRSPKRDSKSHSWTQSACNIGPKWQR